ncbi:DUF4145 domain-containing protein [Methylobacterium sp. ARG-1]|uniref:DUF4145 domain-containing protein n=1 Tax=Methylobacterium sp. ARG-1 TaxID=1692501 RepID=UPI00191055E5|nr:DUF4145 domain-containing protein [Methylobacterium sp. ARG-1]
MTFDIAAFHLIFVEHRWQHHYEAYSICRKCNSGTIFAIKNKADRRTEDVNENISRISYDITELFDMKGYVSLKNVGCVKPPEFLPPPIRSAFDEGAKCISAGCWNAAATMFRMALDLATRPLLPPEGTTGINRRTRRDLGMRLPWLFDHGKLPEALRELSAAIHQDGNDGAHQGTLTKADALDLLDFTEALLTRLFTEPERLRLAAERRATRRAAE